MAYNQFRRCRVDILARGEAFSAEDLARELRKRGHNRCGPRSTVRAVIGLKAVRELRELHAATRAELAAFSEQNRADLAAQVGEIVAAPVWVRRYDEARRAEMIGDLS